MKSLTKKSKLRPKVHNPKEREVDINTIKEIACNARRAHVLRHRVDRHLGAGLDTVAVGAAVGLLVGERGAITEGLWAVGSVLWCYHHDNGIVKGKHDQGEQHGGKEHGLRGGVAFAYGEDIEPEAEVTVSGGAR